MTNQKSKLYKVQVFVPVSAEAKVRQAIGEAGEGRIGDYDHCISATKSVGYFKPLEGSNPSIGRIGEITEVDEVKLEFPCVAKKVSQVIKAIKAVRFYEEIAIDIIPMVCEEDL